MKNCKIIGLEEFNDILAPRRQTSDILWASKRWVPVLVYQATIKTPWLSVNDIILNSLRLNDILDELSSEQDIDKKILFSSAQKILKEIAYKRVEPVLRWAAFFAIKIMKNFFISVFVNENKFLHAKSQMGSNPVLVLPTHRSYLDFVLIAILAFHYEMDVPRIAAGMDFYSMAVVGKLIRDSCGFFIRRTFNSDKLYSAIFSQYAQTLVSYEDAPIEFFIEGTRSRTGKALAPKFGLLKMTITPFLTGQVPDMTILPISISYDRTVEEALLAYELLGVPKPKESTKALYKALQVLKTSYGNVFIHLGETVSVRDFFGKEIDRSVHNHGPVDLQNITPTEFSAIKRLGHSVVHQQQNLTVLTCFNLMATVMNHHMIDCKSPLRMDNLIAEVGWLVEFYRKLGAKVAVENNVADDVSKTLVLHKKFVTVTSEREIKLLRIHSASGEIDRSKMKGHLLLDKTMDIAVPFLFVQYYSNPCAHFIVNIAFIIIIMESAANELPIDSLIVDFKFLRLLYSFEFVFHLDTEKEDFERALELGKMESAIVQSGNCVSFGANTKLRKYCISFLRNYILSYLVLTDVLMKETDCGVSNKRIITAYQELVEKCILSGTNVHPASLSIDLVTNALNSFTLLGALKNNLRESSSTCEIDKEGLKNISLNLNKFSSFYGEVDVKEHFSNFIIGKL